MKVYLPSLGKDSLAAYILSDGISALLMSNKMVFTDGEVFMSAGSEGPLSSLSWW